jgi:ATP synthase protein I
MRAEHRGADNPIAWIASFGVVGWTVVVPTLLGLFVGRILDDRIESSVSFTITLLVAGAFVGLIGAWQWVDSETRRGRR